MKKKSSLPDNVNIPIDRPVNKYLLKEFKILRSHLFPVLSDQFNNILSVVEQQLGADVKFSTSNKVFMPPKKRKPTKEEIFQKYMAGHR